jgi:hypothetical protein
MRVHRHAIREPGSWRGWLNLITRESPYRVGLELSCEVATRWRSGLIATVELGGDEEHVELTLAVLGLFVHLGLASPLTRRTLGWLTRPGRLGYGGREFGIKIHDGRLRMLIAAPDFGSTREPRFTWTRFLRGGRAFRRTFRPEPLGDHCRALGGWELTIAPLDTLLGPRRTDYDAIRTVRAVVPMPEGAYPCAVTLADAVCRRPRWPWRKQRWPSADVALDTPIPVPGKGENAWDCDDDAIHSHHGPAADVAAALAAVTESALRDRERYATLAWTPAAGWPVLEGSR